MLAGWLESGSARSMQWGVDAGKVFGGQLGKITHLFKASTFVGLLYSPDLLFSSSSPNEEI
jgi:hypothetical protein